MDINQMDELSTSQVDLGQYASTVFPAQGLEAKQVEPASCSTCGSGGASEPPTFVYAIGKIEPRFPRLSLEKEFAQATGRVDTAGLTDGGAFHKVLSQRENRYLLKQLCWVFTIEGLETYLVHPRDPADLDLLLESLRATPSQADVDVIVGLRGPIAPASFCNGLMLPIVMFDQIYSFDVASLIKAIPRPKEISAKDFPKSAEEIFTRIMRMVDNAGATDEHRALNYLALRYHAIYAQAAECHSRSCSLSGVEVRPSRLSGTRNILDIIFSYTNRQTDVLEKYFVRVDVSEEFPFLVTKLASYFDL
jgi:hypothetical protein